MTYTWQFTIGEVWIDADYLPATRKALAVDVIRVHEAISYGKCYDISNLHPKCTLDEVVYFD